MKFFKNIKYIFNSVYCCFRYVPIQAVIYLIILIFLGLVPVLQIPATAGFINNAINYYENGTGKVLIWIMFLAAISVVEHLVWSTAGLVHKRSMLLLRKRFRTGVLEKCARLEYKYIEDSDSWDVISRMTTSPESEIWDGFDSLLGVVSIVISVVGIMSFIAAQSLLSAGIILLCCIPLFWLSIKSGKVNYKTSIQAEKLNRRSSVLSGMMNDREYADERTLFQYTEKTNSEFKKAYREAFVYISKTLFKWTAITKSGGILSALSGVLVLCIMLPAVISGSLSMGLYISIITAVFSMSTQLSWWLGSSIDNAIKGMEFMKDMDRLMHFDEMSDALSPPIYSHGVGKIEFCNVSFTYPGTEAQILKDVSFVLVKGKHYAFVGANGAGKTTIIKLLTGLYSNYTGEILVDGKELRTLDAASLKGLYSVVYQDYVHHSFTVRENCAMGNVALLENNTENTDIEKALESTHMTDAVNALPNGISTLLGKQFEGGADLSGGQWQRLTLARAIISPAPVRVLDEPTAALDPVSESHMYELFSEISKDTLTILISHRLGSTKIADEILVFDEGAVTERGSSDELLNKKGLYFEMFEQQRSWYQ